MFLLVKAAGGQIMLHLFRGNLERLRLQRQSEVCPLAHP